MLQTILLVYFIGSLLSVGISYTTITIAIQKSPTFKDNYNLSWYTYVSYFFLSWLNIFFMFYMFFISMLDKEEMEDETILYFTNVYKGKHIVLTPTDMVCMLTRYYINNYFLTILQNGSVVLFNHTPNILCKKYKKCKQCPFEQFATKTLPGCEELVRKIISDNGIEDRPNYSLIDEGIIYFPGDKKDLENFCKMLQSMSHFFESFYSIKR